MKSNTALTSSPDCPENISEQHLKIFYRNSTAKRTQNSRIRILRKFKIYTAEEAQTFENIFEVVYPGFFGRMEKENTMLLSAERTIVALLKMKLDEKRICRNMGITLEELRRTVFNISRKTGLPVATLHEIIVHI